MSNVRPSLPVRTSPTTCHLLNLADWVIIYGPNLAPIRASASSTSDAEEWDNGLDPNQPVHLVTSPNLLALMGIPVHIRAILDPFVLALMFGLDGKPQRVLIIDTRTVCIAPCTPAWKEAYFTAYKDIQPGAFKATGITAVDQGLTSIETP